MTSEEFWKDDPQLFYSFRTSFLNKQKRKYEEMDYECWKNGQYVHDGNGTLLLYFEKFISSCFSKTKNKTELGEYPKKPYHILLEENENKEKIKKEKELKLNQQIMVQGSIKYLYLEKMKRKVQRHEEL